MYYKCYLLLFLIIFIHLHLNVRCSSSIIIIITYAQKATITLFSIYKMYKVITRFFNFI